MSDEIKKQPEEKSEEIANAPLPEQELKEVVGGATGTPIEVMRPTGGRPVKY